MGEDAFASGVLDPKVHSSLVERLDELCAQASVPKHYVWDPFDCEDPVEQDYALQFPIQAEKKVPGLVYVGLSTLIVPRMHAMAGFLIRNFIDARMMTLREVVVQYKENQPPSCTALFIPGFSDPIKGINQVSKFDAPVVFSMLLDRFSQGKQTILSINKPLDVVYSYGHEVGIHVKRFVWVGKDAPVYVDSTGDEEHDDFGDPEESL